MKAKKWFNLDHQAFLEEKKRTLDYMLCSKAIVVLFSLNITSCVKVTENLHQRRKLN